MWRYINMPLPVPNIDDRTFDELAAEARAMIPKYFPQWTDHNPSDPGIAFLEIFAFLFEIAIYQINRVPERSLEHFAALIGVKRDPDEEIEETLRRALTRLQSRYRAITAADFERLARRAAPDAIARTKAVVSVEDTENVWPDEQFMNIVVVPNGISSSAPTPTLELRETVFDFLRKRRLITTRVRVIEPVYDDLSIAVTVVRESSTHLSQDEVRRTVTERICDFLNPLKGGLDGNGWEFGRSVFRSELYQLIEGIDGVDHVKRLMLDNSETENEIPLSSPTSLVRLDADQVTVNVLDND